MTRLRFMLSVYFLIPILAGTSCGPIDRGQPSFEIRDSLGIQIVESSTPLWEEEGSAWTVGPSPSIAISADPEDLTYYLGSAWDPALLGDGRLVVADAVNDALFFFDPSGVFLSSVGRQGEGPGEFQSVLGVFQCGQDTLVVQESSRVSILDPWGGFLRTERVAGRLTTGRVNLEGVSEDCSSVLLVESHYSPPSMTDGVHQIPTTLHWASLDGLRRDTVKVFGGRDVFALDVGGQAVSSPLPFGRTPVWAEAKGDVYFGDASGPEVLQLDSKGSVRRIIRWAAEPHQVSRQDWESYDLDRMQFLEEAPEEAPYVLPSNRVPGPRKRPSYAGLLVDDDSNLWVRQYGANDYMFAMPDETESKEAWWVFDPRGRWLGTIEFPTRFKLYSVRVGQAVGVFRDDLDRPNVWVMKIGKRPS